MDTVLSLLKVEDDDTAIKLEFTKHRLLTQSNREQFRSVTIYPGEGWRWEATSNDAAPKGPRTQKIVEREFVIAYDRLSDGAGKSPGFDGKLVLKAPVDAIRDDLKSRGHLELDEDWNLPRAARTMLYKAKSSLVSTNAPFAEKDGLIWRKWRRVSLSRHPLGWWNQW
jgi:hypothetical protein